MPTPDYYDAPGESAVAIYSTVIDIGSLPSLALFFYILYVLLAKSPSYMYYSKWLLLNTATSCFLYDLVIYVWKPITVPYHSFYYSNGLVKNQPGWVCVSFSAMAIIAFANLAHSLMVYMAYRYSCILPADEGHLLSTRRQLVGFGLGTWVVTVISPIIVVFFSAESQSDIDAWVAEHSASNKSVVPLLRATIPSLASSDVSRSLIAVLGLVLTCLSCLFAGVVMSGLNVKYFRMITCGGGYSKLSERTKTLQWMLYRAQTFQLVFFFAFQILPVLVVVALQLVWYVGIDIPISSYEYNSFALAFTSFHSFTDYFSILYFIRPYREFTKVWLLYGLRLARKNSIRACRVEISKASKATSTVSMSESGRKRTVSS